MEPSNVEKAWDFRHKPVHEFSCVPLMSSKEEDCFSKVWSHLKTRGDSFFDLDCLESRFQSESGSLDISHLNNSYQVQPYFNAVALPQNTRYMNTV